MRYSKACCDNCGTLGIVKNACVGGMDTSQCATCRNADPENDMNEYHEERGNIIEDGYGCDRSDFAVYERGQS